MSVGWSDWIRWFEKGKRKTVSSSKSNVLLHASLGYSVDKEASLEQSSDRLKGRKSQNQYSVKGKKRKEGEKKKGKKSERLNNVHPERKLEEAKQGSEVEGLRLRIVGLCGGYAILPINNHI